METLIHLDTHVVVWLYLGDRKRLRPAWKTLEDSDLVISPIVSLELQYLFEVGRTTEPAETVVSDLLERIGLRMSEAPFPRVVQHALLQNWTRDPFDRLIVGNALVENLPLLTFDDTIRAHCSLAFWR
jgi:PIN domain nuclease of toxin-antitoxin system